MRLTDDEIVEMVEIAAKWHADLILTLPGQHDTRASSIPKRVCVWVIDLGTGSDSKSC